MDEEQAVFEQLTLSDSKKWGSIALKVFYFILKALLVLKILKFRLEFWVISKKACNTHIDQYLKK